MGKKDLSNQNNPKQELKSVSKQIIKDIDSTEPKLLHGIKNKREVVEGILSRTVKYECVEYSEMHQGPLPAPKVLNGYNEIIPNGAERIMASFESQSKHRQDIEKKVVNGQVNQSLLGQILGFAIAIFFLLGGGFLIVNGFVVSGTIISTLDIVGLVSVFVIGKYKREKSIDK